MGTPFTAIYDLALIVIEDYRINKLASANKEAFYNYMRGFLVSGMSEFTGNLQSLDYISQQETDIQTGETSTVYYFVNTLTSKEQSILAKTIVYKWATRQVQDYTKFNPPLNVKEFKNQEVPNSVKQRSEYLDKLLENIHYDIEQYQLSDFSKLPFFGG